MNLFNFNVSNFQSNILFCCLSKCRRIEQTLTALRRSIEASNSKEVKSSFSMKELRCLSPFLLSHFMNMYVDGCTTKFVTETKDPT